MSWQDDPVVRWGRNPKSPADFPFESQDERIYRAALALNVMESEKGEHPDPQALERDIARTKQIAGNTTVAAPKPAAVPAPAPWEQDEAVAPWQLDTKPTSWWDTIAAIPSTTVGQIKKSIGGYLQSLGETNLAHEEAAIAAERGGGPMRGAPPLTEQPHVKYIAKKTGRTVEDVAGDFEGEEFPIAQSGRRIFREGQLQVEAASPGELSFWQEAALVGGSSLLAQLPTLAASVATRSPAPALAGAAAQTYGSSYGEAREEGLEPGRAVTHAGFDAVVEAAMEYLPMKFMLDKMGGPVLSLIAGTLVREVGTEMATTMLQSANAKLSTRPDMTWEEYGKDILDTAASTAISAPLLAGAAKVMSPLGRPAQRAEEAMNAPPAPPATAEDWVARARFGEVGVEGPINEPLTGPNIDEPTIVLDSAQEQNLRAQMNAIEPTEDENQLKEARRLVEEFRKQQKAPPLPGAEAAWAQISTAPTSPVEDIGELGASKKSAANAAAYINPNQEQDRLDRVFTYGPEGYVGLTPRQVLPKPGTYTLGVPSDDRPADYLRALHDTVEEWRTKWLPNDTIVLSNEQLFSNSALGWHYHTDKNSHMIVPAVLRKPSRGLGQYNPNTQATAFYNATHEFGHALIVSKFFENATADQARAVRDESRQGVVKTQVEGPTQAVIDEFNAIKQRVLTGAISAEEFMTQWMGPAKLGRANFLKDLGVAPSAPAMDLVNSIIRRAAGNSNIKDEISRKALTQRLREDYLSLDEYLAEQFARHAYKSKYDQQTPLGKFFADALRGLRGFFVDRKKDGVIAPGTAFQEWLSGISKTARADEATALTENKKRAGRPKAKSTTAVVKPAAKATPAKRVKKVAHNVESSTEDRVAKKALKNVAFLEKAKAITPEQAAEMRELIDRQDWDEFVERFQGHAAKQVKFEVDTGEHSVVLAGTSSEKSEAKSEWSIRKFDSRFFKAFFGDWRRDPENASVVRVGVFVQNYDGTLVVDKDLASPPLTLFVPLERIRRGENTFHAGSLRGAVYAESLNPQPVSDPSVVPVVLNIRNPYIVGDLTHAAPDRATLEAQGFDGIVYQNDFEGDVSFIAFRPDQVKVLEERQPYPRDTGVHLELDSDQATPEGHGVSKLWRGVKNFVHEPGPLRRALRRVSHLSRHVLQIQQLAHIHPDLTDLSYLANTNTEYTRYGSSRRAEADRILNEWKDLGKENFSKVNRFLLAEKESGQNWFELVKGEKEREGIAVPWWQFQMSETAKEKFRQHGINPDTDYGRHLAEHVLKIKNNLLDYLNEDEQVLQEVLGHRYGHSVPVLNAAVLDLKTHIHQLRQSPFFPEGRFGNFVLTISKKRDSGPGWEVVYREAFESRAKWEAAVKRAEARAKPDEKIRKHEVTDATYVLMSLPTDFVDLAASELGLSESQIESLTQLLQPVKQEKLLSDFDKSRLGIKGYSSDAMRSYANFTWHHSNAQAKLLYRRKFNLAITNMRQKLREAEVQPGEQAFNEVGRLTRVVRAMETMRDYVMSPPNEAQSLRALVSVGYLALNVKTALVNLYGLATVWSDLTTRYGAVDGEKRFIRASYYAASSMRLTNLDDRKKGNYLPPDIQRGLDKAIEEGVLTQSYAYHLAGMANQTVLSRLTRESHLAGMGQKVVDLGMYPFRLMELATRRITFVAQLEAELQKTGAGFEEAYEAAVAKTNKLQNDYSLGNRVPIMRGGALGLGPVVPMITIFASFAQHMAFHGFGGYELGQRREQRRLVKEGQLSEEHDPKWYQWGYGYTARIWLLTLMLAGYEGLPGAENILDLLESVWRRINPKKPLRQELRELVQSIDQDPVQWSRGLGANVLGFDISRSVGFGRLMPGTDVFARSSDQDPEKAVGAAALDIAGPLGGFIKFGLEWYAKPTREAMKYAPGGIGNLVNSYIWSQDGVRGPSGGLITLERGDDGRLRPRELTTAEIAGKALGFNPEIVARNREILFATHDRKMYWQAKRIELLKSHVRAREEGDREAIADARQAITDFNLDVPNEEWNKDFKISGRDIHAAWMRYRKGQKMEEAGQPRERRYRDMAEDIRRSFEKPQSSP